MDVFRLQHRRSLQRINLSADTRRSNLRIRLYLYRTFLTDTVRIRTNVNKQPEKNIQVSAKVIRPKSVLHKSEISSKLDQDPQ